MQLQLTVFLQNVLAGKPGTSKSMHESSIYEVDDIFEAIMSQRRSRARFAECHLQKQNPVPAYSQETVVTNLEIGTIKTFEDVSVCRGLSTFLCYK